MKEVREGWAIKITGRNGRSLLHVTVHRDKMWTKAEAKREVTWYTHNYSDVLAHCEIVRVRETVEEIA